MTLVDWIDQARVALCFLAVYLIGYRRGQMDCELYGSLVEHLKRRKAERCAK